MIKLLNEPANEANDAEYGLTLSMEYLPFAIIKNGITKDDEQDSDDDDDADDDGVSMSQFRYAA